jgi:EAL domain-containing protein (putative c-di-GMP-specific phosphodiesterase class I)
MEFVKNTATLELMSQLLDEPVISSYLPVFQPIVSLINRQIYGYESLGRIQTPSGLVSLGGFFHPENKQLAPDTDVRLQIDRHLRRLALARFAAEAPPQTKLFINIAPAFIVHHLQELIPQAPYTIQLVRELGIDPSRIVIELTEASVEHGVEPLLAIIQEYRAAGFGIAVDDVGAEASNLDRIGLFRPDILKLDRALLQKAVTDQGFKAILLSLSRLAESLGASLLSEGVETTAELNVSLRSGARYVQGYLFSAAQPNFAPVTTFDGLLRQQLSGYVEERRREIHQRRSWERQILGDLITMRIEAEHRQGKIFLNLAGFSVPETPIKKIWLTDLAGNQISPNYRFRHKTCIEDQSAFGLNWSTRPYFFDHLRQTNRRSGWSLSDVYQDISEHRFVRTFSHRFGPKALLFIDVPVEAEI